MSDKRDKLKLTKTERERFGRIRTLDQLHALDPVEFEKFCGYLYRLQGYAVWTTATSGDQGVDLYLEKGRRKAVVQCKRYQGTVGQPLVRDLYGTMLHNGASEAALVTTGQFSRSAEAWAANKPLFLIDGNELISWARQERLRAEQSGRSRLMQIGIIVGVLIVLAAVVGGVTFALNNWSPPSAGSPTPVSLIVPTVAGEPGNPATPVPAATATLPLAATATPRGSGPAPVEAPRVAAPPAIDGSLADWGAPATTASAYIVYTAPGIEPVASVTARWQLAWDADYLYVGVSVTDNRHVQTQSGRLAYRGDSVELQIDTQRNTPPDSRVAPDDFQLLLSPGDFAGNGPSFWRFQGNPNGAFSDTDSPAVPVAAQRTADGYVLESAVPWSLLATTPTAGLRLGLALNVNDNDSAESAAQEMMLSNVSGRRLSDPSTWGVLVLQP